MAQKRMFDKAIIETDKFLNVSLSAKAIYFLLGMEADDEGFVSPNRILRLYGGEAGDLKNLIDVGLIIPFKSGVVVITDWNQNNWLDNRRIKPTQYQNEKKNLILTEEKKYVLSIRSASAQLEERRGEQYRREETPSKEINHNLGFPLPEGWTDDSFLDSDGQQVPNIKDENGQKVKQSEITKRRKQYEITQKSLKTRETNKKEEDPDTKRLLESLRIAQGMKWFDRRQDPEVISNFKSKLMDYLTTEGGETQEDAERDFLELFENYLRKIKTKSDFHWKNAISFDYLNKNFTKIIRDIL